MSERIIQEAAVAERQVVELCEAGRYREAAIALEGLDPETHSLLFGIVEIFRGNQERAKDYLSRAVRETGEDRAKVQLACAYYHTGETKEARAILKDLPERFDVLLLRGIIASDLDPRGALKLLDRAAGFPAPPGQQARLHNQRAIVLRRLGKTDRAIQEYDAAIHYFEEAKSDCLAATINNLARVFLDCGECERAHSQLDRAIVLLARDADHLAKSYDEKARIYLAEKNLEMAEKYARMAVRESEPSERKAWLAECLTTHARVLFLKGDYTTALVQADRAEEIGRFLNNDQVILEIYPVKRGIGYLIAKRAEIDRLETHIRVAGGVRPAAKKLGISHVTLIRNLRRLQGSLQ